MKYLVIFYVLIGILVTLSVNNIYAMPPIDSQTIYDFSDVIVLGQVISVNSTFSPAHNLYEIKVEKFLKNSQDSNVLFAVGQKTAHTRLGNHVFSVNDRGLFFLNNNTMGYDLYSGIWGMYSESQLVEPEWNKCNIFEKEIQREHWVFGGRGPMPTIHQENNTDTENFTTDKEIIITYDIFNHSLNAKNVTYGIMIKNLDESDLLYAYTELNNSYLLESCVPYKTLMWAFTPSKSGHYTVEFYDLTGSRMTIGFTAKQSLPFCTSDREACFQDEYICDPTGWECADTKNIFNIMIDSPLKQLKSGIAIDQIQCKEGFVVAMKKSNGNPNCVKRETLEKLRERDWVEPLGDIVFQRSSQSEPEPENVSVSVTGNDAKDICSALRIPCPSKPVFSHATHTGNGDVFLSFSTFMDLLDVKLNQTHICVTSDKTKSIECNVRLK